MYNVYAIDKQKRQIGVSRFLLMDSHVIFQNILRNLTS